MSEKIFLSQLRENIEYSTINHPEKLNSLTKEVPVEMEGLGFFNGLGKNRNISPPLSSGLDTKHSAAAPIMIPS